MASEVLLLIGPPGAGKGTQADALSGRKRLFKLSTGDMLRDHVARGTELGSQAKAFMDAGDLVPDDLIIAMVREQVDAMDEIRILLDGFPRTPAQAEALDAMLAEYKARMTGVVLLEVPEDELVQRLLERAREEGRSDDNEETIRNRMEVYRTSTRPLIDFYRQRGLLRTVDGVGDVAEVTSRIEEVLA
ncbi:MAG: adenylate kinase [Trueperaceae bacterium]